MHTNEPAIPGDKSKQECKQQDSANTEEGASGSSQAMRGMRAILKPEEQVVVVGVGVEAVAQEGSFLAENTVFIKATGKYYREHLALAEPDQTRWSFLPSIYN